MARSRFLLLCAVVIWGWTFVATKVCLDYLTPLELLGWRLLIALPVLLAILLSRGLRIDFRTRPRALATGALIIGVHFYIQIWGLKYTTATNTGWIIAVTPLVLALLAFLILKEPLRRDLLIGIAVATLGILLLVSGGRIASLDWIRSVGDWLVLASAHTWALYTIAVRDVARSQPPLAVTCAVLCPPTVVVGSVVLFTADWDKLRNLPLEPLLALLFLGVFGMALAQWFWQQGLAGVGAAEAGTFLYLEPLSTTALAVPYLGERFGLLTLAGGLLVLTGVWWARTPSRDRRPPPG